MNKIKVSIIRRPTDPLELLGFAIRMTYIKKTPREILEMCGNMEYTKKLVKNIILMNHTSVLEHLVYTFLIEGASRSFLAQITRHRMASYTSASQHYQVYSNFSYIYPKDLRKTGLESEYNKLMKTISGFYDKLRSTGMPHYEARQVLPNACRNNIVVTINARSLFNFINLRLCRNNTPEIMIVAKKMRALLIDDCPDVFKYSGTDCMLGECKQGHRSCNNPYIANKSGVWQ